MLFRSAILRSWSISLGITALITGPALGQAAIDATTASRIDSALAALVDENRWVGLQVAIGIDGTVAWTGSYGMADLEHDAPVTHETPFRTASTIGRLIAERWMLAPSS